MRVPTAVGVDVGGTWIRLKGLDADGRCLWSLQKPSPSVEELPAALKKYLKRFNGKLPALAVGSRGVWKAGKRQAVKRALHGLAKTIVVMSDVEAAWLAAFGEHGEGIIIISGTGSIAYGRKADGTFARAGGLGPDKGDEGSGHWIGREWLLRTGRSKDLLKKNVRQVAALAPAVIRKAKARDLKAAPIIREAQGHLADLIQKLMKELSWRNTIPVSVSGSVLENAWFKRGVLATMRRKKIRFKSVSKKWDAATALAIFNLQSAIDNLQ